MNDNDTGTERTERGRTIRYDLGTFEGFNFRSQSTIPRNLTAAEVVAWEHDREGEAEFWPAGDRPEVLVLFRSRSCITATDLIELDRLLGEVGGDSVENFLRVHYAVNVSGTDLSLLSREAVEDNCIEIFLGATFTDLRREAAYQLFELFYPVEYRAWEKTTCDGLIFDTNRFLDSPAFAIEEIQLGDQVALLVASQ
ncbi:MAG: hypothetical protein NT154_17195 [Verrucomicrobia bacterium]|nr:hypothetical protein [Verrucomicrobiota bacterium]